MKKIIFAAVLFLAMPVAASAQSYGGYYNEPQGFFWPYGTGIGAPREVLTVHAWGPTDAPSYHTMNSGYAYQPQTYQPAYQPSYQYQQQYFPQQQYSFMPQQYQSYTPQLNYGFQQPQYYGGYGQPTGGTDIWGAPACNWGADYMGYSCGRDPHQWIYDPYSGTYY